MFCLLKEENDPMYLMTKFTRYLTIIGHFKVSFGLFIDFIHFIAIGIF